MADLAGVLKSEIRRLARKETKQLELALKQDLKRLRDANSGLKKRVTELEATVRGMESGRPTPEPVETSEDASAGRGWITAKGVKSLRSRLGLTRAEFAKLTGSTVQTVYNWERSSGTLRLRTRTREKLMPLRGIRTREARAMLAEME